MDFKAIYKGSQYVAIWIVVYLMLKYVVDEGISDVDAALTASVLTLILLIAERSLDLKYLKHHDDRNVVLQQIEEHMTNQNNVKDVDINSDTVTDAIDKGLQILSETIDSANGVTIDASVDKSDDSIDMNVSLFKSTNSNQNPQPKTNIPNPSAGSENSTDISPSLKLRKDVENIDITGSSYNNINNQNRSKEPYYVETDFLGGQVIFDRNDFGGTFDLPNAFDTNKTVEFGQNQSSDSQSSDSQSKDSQSKDSQSKDSNASQLEQNTQAKVDPGNNVIMMQQDTVNLKPNWYEQDFNPRDYTGAENLDQIATSNNKTRDDMLVNTYRYSDFNRMPPSFNQNDFEYGYSFLPPKDWYPLPPYPPVCVAATRCPVQGVYTDSTTMDLKDWRSTQKITHPDSINTEYIANELNSKA